MAEIQSENLGQNGPIFGDDINLNAEKVLPRDLTIYIESLNTTQDDDNKLSTTDMLGWFQTKFNVAEVIKCFQKVNNTFYVTCQDNDCKEALLNDFSRFEIRGIVYIMRNAHPLTWETRKSYIDITIYNLPFEIKPDSVVQKFRKYTSTIIELRSPTFRSFPTIQSGVRVVRVKSLHTHIPRRIFIKGQLITVKYDGQPQPEKKCHNCGEYGHISRECSHEKRPVWGFSSSRTRPFEGQKEKNEDEGSETGIFVGRVGFGTGFPPFDTSLSSNKPKTDEADFPNIANTEILTHKDDIEGQPEETSKENEPEVREINIDSQEPIKERLETNQIQKDEVSQQNDNIENTEEMEEGEVIDIENEGKILEQNVEENTSAEDLIDVVTEGKEISETVTIEKTTLPKIDDDFSPIEIISPITSPVKNVSVVQDVDKPLKPKYQAKDFQKVISENNTDKKKSTKGKKNEKRIRLSTGESDKDRKEKKSKQ